MRMLFRLALTLLLALAAASARAENPDALWQIVHDRCVPGQQAHGSPAPCTLVDLAGGYVVLKDRDGVTQYLLIPTAKVTGIEDPAVLAPGAPNYFDAAWKQRGLVDTAARQTLPEADIALTINSEYGRTQNQLHIHIDCMRPDVVAALHAHGTSVGTAWAPFPIPLAGQPYIARRIGGADLSTGNPFALLADGVPGARADMGKWTLAVASDATAAAPDLILLAGHVDLAAGDRGSAEELQDHACAIKTSR
jgi:CDP-diacylglycerol pyrophosphatase